MFKLNTEEAKVLAHVLSQFEITLIPEDTQVLKSVKVRIDDYLKNGSSPGRPKKADHTRIQQYKSRGFTQETVAKTLCLSLSTVRRNWNEKEP